MAEPHDLKYTAEHEWILVDGDTATVGITAYAAEQLGDVVFVETPDVGKTVKAGDGFAVVESVKAASEVYAPVGGEVTASNPDLTADPAKVNADPEGDGWFFKLKGVDAGEFGKLMTKAQYDEFVKGL